MNTLLLNLTRFGDLLQTQPIVSALKERGHTVGLVCLENFAPAAQLLRHVDSLHALPGARLLALMDRDWRQGLGEFWSWRSEVLTSFPPNNVLNLTASLSVRLLSRLLAPPLKDVVDDTDTPASGGFSLDEYGFGICSNPWTSFLLASTQNRGCSPFNLVDLFWNAAALGSGPREYRLREPEPELMDNALSILAANGPRENNGFVAFQLGASEERRRWPVASFAALGEMLWQELRLCPVLLGSGGERELGERYQTACQAPCVDLIGHTTPLELAATLMHTSLLVSNDTGTMHLAAGLDRPVAAIFLATAQPWDTGPYKPGNLCLEPDLDCHPCAFGSQCPRNEVCRKSVQPETLFECIREFLASGTWDRPHMANIVGSRVWETRLEEDGRMGLASLSGHDEATRTKWVRMQRHFYRQFLDQQDILPPNVPWEFSPEDAEKIKTVLTQSAALLRLLQEQANVLTLKPLDGVKAKFMASWQRLETLWDQSPHFNVLGYLWMAESQESGRDMEAVQALIQRYRGLMEAWLIPFSK